MTSKPKKVSAGKRPSRHVLLHNHVRRTVDMRQGQNGFRFWYDDLGRYTESSPPTYIKCECGWRPDFGTHYRIEGVGDPNYRVEKEVADD